MIGFFRFVLVVLLLTVVAMTSALATMHFAIHGGEVAIPDFRGMTIVDAGERAASMGLQYLSLQSSMYTAEALLNSKNNAAAREQLERILGTSERLGTRLLTARINYLIANSMRAAGNPEAGARYSQVLSLLDEIKKEAGSEHLLDRADLHSIYDDATRWSHAKAPAQSASRS